MPTREWSSDAILEVLRTTPRRLERLVAELDEARLTEPLEVEGWSVQDIVAHLRACDAQWGTDLERFVADEAPSYRYVSPRQSIARTSFSGTAVLPAMAAFAADRAALLEWLEPLESAWWSRTATVTMSRGVESWTARRVATRLAEHEAEHLAHLERSAPRE